MRRPLAARRMPIRVPALPHAIVLLLLSPAALSAQGWIDVERRPELTRLPGPVVRVGSEVRISVEGRVARVEVEEHFRNTGGSVAEGSYLYPLPGEAAFTNFSLWQGDQELRGETMNAEQARRIYEEIVRRRKDPALLTLAGHGLVRAQVFPIQAGETRKVALRYTQLLGRSGDALRLRYTLGLRGPESTTNLRLTLGDSQAYGTPYSPTHQIERRTVGGRLELAVSPGAGGDVELFLPLRRGIAGTSLVTHAPAGEDGYFMLLLAPTAAEPAAAVARDLTLVVDVSGSMSGTKLEQAKAALEQALGTLSPGDRFRLIAFSSTIRPFRPDLVPATREDLAQAREFIAGLGAEGGTNIAGALEMALALPADAERLSLVVFVTDGLPSVGEQVPDRIAEAAAARVGRSRIFTVGVGHDVNTYLLDRLATQGRGAVEYVPPGASVETAVGSLMTKLRFPALVNLRLGDAPVPLTLVQPAQLPDLFYGEELVVFGRYRGHATGRLVVTGEREGRRERLEVEAAFPASDLSNDFIPRLWASRRVGELTRQLRLEGPTQSLIDEIKDLGLRHGVLTEYTAYLVQEPGALAEARAPMPRREDPDLQTGAAAFDRARASSMLSQAKSLDEAERLAPREASTGSARRAGGRTFVSRGEVWTDVAHADRIPVTVVAPFSTAYFELVRMLPEIASYLSVGEAVLVAGRRGSVRIGPAGIQEWDPGQLAAVVHNFRGT